MDSILSTRLTLLYGQSGLGKSSLLRALVIPDLENEDVRVVYFDAWAGENPTRDLKHSLVQAADQIGIPDASRGAPTLTELVRLLTSEDGKTLVLILDQFEEFLTRHAERFEPLGKELGALVRAEGLDAHVLISLREEFLASLEPLRSSILSLFKSTYRLVPLDDEGVRGAIEEPPRGFGVEMEPELVERLIADLRESVEQLIKSQRTERELIEPRNAAVERSVDLPMLQLVCGRLWDEAVKMPEPRLSVALYERLRGAQKIVEQYVRGVMPSERGDRLLTAELLKFLAPPSGLKALYAASDLAALGRLDETSIEVELERLARARILRTREVGGRLCYELQHDAFIRVLRPWMKVVNRERRKRKRRVRIAASAVLLAMVVSAVTWFVQQEKASRDTWRAQTSDRLERLDKDTSPARAAVVFDDVVGFWLSSDPKGKRDEELADLLKKYESKLPKGYGIYQSGIQFVRLPGFLDHWPLELQHAEDRNISKRHFQLHWQLSIDEFAARWGMPLPPAVLLQSNPELKGDEMRLVSPSFPRDVPLEAPTVEDLPYIDEGALTPRAKLFLAKFAVAEAGPWSRVPYEEESSFRSVPLWSLPVWNVAGNGAYDGAGALVRLVEREIPHEPSLSLSPTIVELLLGNLAVKDRPMVVREARAARGDNIASDLAELVRLGRPLKHLGAILDQLANHPSGQPAAVAGEVDRVLNEKSPPIAMRARGPWDNLGKRQAPAREVEPPEDGPGLTYFYVFYWPARRYLPIRIYLGASVEAEVMPDHRASNAIGAARRAHIERYGVGFPPVRLYKQDEVGSNDLGPNQFRIEVAAESASDLGAQPKTVEAGKAVDTIRQALTDRTTAFRTHWLQPDEVARLRDERLSAPTQTWLDQRYSLTDLKHLLRRVIAPSANGSESPESTLAHLDWLLQSLVFWAEIEDIHDLASLGERLRDTQRARLMSRDSTPAGAGVARKIAAGIRELSAGNLDRASAAFERAARQDRQAAIAVFLKSYPDSLESSFRARYEAKCPHEKPSQDWWKLYPKLTLEDQVEFAAYAGSGEDAAFGRSLQVCTIASMRESRRAPERRKLMDALVAGDSDFSSWPPNESGALAKRLLIENDSDDAREAAQALLVAAITRWPLIQAESAFAQLAEHECGRDSDEGTAWCTALLQRLAEARPDSEKMSDILTTRARSTGKSPEP